MGLQHHRQLLGARCPGNFQRHAEPLDFSNLQDQLEIHDFRMKTGIFLNF